MSDFEFPEPRPRDISLNANLRQAVEWIAFGLKPVDKTYEAITRKVENIQNSDKKEIDHAKRLLTLALYEGNFIANARKEIPTHDLEKEEVKWYEIPPEIWKLEKIQWDNNTLSYSDRNSFINIYIRTHELYQVFPASLNNKLAPVDSSPEINTVSSNYLSPYMHLLNLAVTEFNITATNQPSKKILCDWFLDKLKTVQGEQYVSESKAKMLSTFVREPESQIGGLKKLKKNNS